MWSQPYLYYITPHFKYNLSQLNIYINVKIIPTYADFPKTTQFYLNCHSETAKKKQKHV